MAIRCSNNNDSNQLKNAIMIWVLDSNYNDEIEWKYGNADNILAALHDDYCGLFSAVAKDC